MKISFFWLKRLFSLAGIIPIGAFLIMHYYTNAKFLAGPDIFQHGVEFIHYNLPVLLFWEIFMIWLPLAFHGIIGLVIYFQKGQGLAGNVAQYPYARNWWWLIRRLTGVVTFIFIIVHVWLFRFEFYPGMSTQFYTDLKTNSYIGNYVLQVAALFDNIWVFIIMLIGVVSTGLHFGMGIWSFCITWGITLSRKSQDVMAKIGLAFGILISALGIIIAVNMRNFDVNKAFVYKFMTKENIETWNKLEDEKKKIFDEIIDNDSNSQINTNNENSEDSSE